MKYWIKATLAAMLILTGCGTIYYRDLQPGAFSGKLFVMWVGEGSTSGDGKFVFVPAPGSELTFKRPTGSGAVQIIKPGLMYTDGGSIPKVGQLFKGLSPWGYAPAYMIHDWVFEARHCLVDGASDARFSNLRNVDFDESAKILGEAIKTLIRENKVDRNDLAGDAVTSAVSSSIARELWDQKGGCERSKVSKEHLAEINAVFPTISMTTKLRTFQLPPDTPQVSPKRQARIISVIEF
ncbi:hypothetical protein [Neorhizobium sp. T25_13]|uniref:hypothetical protein n=1 Tax=Neorhizobium sp. T25_13 TaxID=2093830 RepID=UPI000CF89F84|nr:hypothetical protein [Neorhizobium sp. T25_13]